MRAHMTQRFQLYLGLARASNLPTVWTNALAAWALAVGPLVYGGLRGNPFSDPSRWIDLALLAVAGSLLYAGGCTLNDAFDEEWDRKHRPDRPIPSGKLSAREVWTVGMVELLLGVLMLIRFGPTVAASGIGVVVAILLYDWLHKKSAWTVFFMGWCRVQWVLTAALTMGVISPQVILYASVLFLYIAFISMTARKEATSKPIEPGQKRRRISVATETLALGMLLIPVAAGGSGGSSFADTTPAIAGMAIFTTWVTWAKQRMSGGGPLIGVFVGRALAGIVLLDAAFACLSWHWLGLWIVLFLPLCLLLQRRIAAT